MHHHEHEHGHDAASANKAYFDEHAHEQHQMPAEYAQRVSTAVFSQYHFDPDTTTVLDFACGSGVVSRAIAAKAKRVVGVDVSTVSVDMFNREAAQHEFSPDRLHAVAAEITGAVGELGGATFDVVTATGAFHHLESPERMAAILAKFLKPAGALIIVDIRAREDGQVFIGTGDKTLAAAVPQQHGFTESRVRKMFADAGLVDVAVADAGKWDIKGHSVDLFVARGVKL